MNDSELALEVWESEGGSRKKLTVSDVRRGMKSHLPEMVYSEMDNGIFWKSLESYDTGDVIIYEGKEYVVRYGWKWTTIATIPIYFAELEHKA